MRLRRGTAFSSSMGCSASYASQAHAPRSFLWRRMTHFVCGSVASFSLSIASICLDTMSLACVLHGLPSCYAKWYSKHAEEVLLPYVQGLVASGDVLQICRRMKGCCLMADAGDAVQVQAGRLEKRGV